MRGRVWQKLWLMGAGLLGALLLGVVLFGGHNASTGSGTLTLSALEQQIVVVTRAKLLGEGFTSYDVSAACLPDGEHERRFLCRVDEYNTHDPAASPFFMDTVTCGARVAPAPYRCESSVGDALQ